MSKHEIIKYVELLFNLLCFRTPLPLSVFKERFFLPKLQLLKKPNFKPNFLNLKKILFSSKLFVLKETSRIGHLS